MSTKNPQPAENASSDPKAPSLFSAFPEPQGWALNWDSTGLQQTPVRKAAPGSKPDKSVRA
jgi:hypothetical protein